MQIIHLLLVSLLPVVSSEVTTFYKAVTQCQPSGFASVEQLQSTSAGGDSYWLPYVRVTLPAWQWLSGQIFNGQITASGSRPDWQECGLIRADQGYNIYDSTSCFSVRHDCVPVCQFEGSCPSKTNNCITVKELNVIIATNITKSWFEAVNQCHALSGNLAALHNINLDEFINALTSKGVQGSRFCVGLRLSKWVSVTDNLTEPVDYQWINNISPDASKYMYNMYNCSVVQRGRWRPAKCDENHKVLCSNEQSYTNLYAGYSTPDYRSVTRNSTESKTGNSTTGASQKKPRVGAIIGGVLGGICVIIAVLIIFRKKITCERQDPEERDLSTTVPMNPTNE